MPPIDVTVERTISAPPAAIAAVMFDPGQDPTWMKALTAARLIDAPLAVGSRAERAARFLGKDIGWTTVVAEYEPNRRLVLDIAEGPFTGTVTYMIEATEAGSRVSITNRGTPGQFGWMPAPLMRTAMRAATAKDLKRLAARVNG